MNVMFETPSELYLRKSFSISAGMMEGLNRINKAGAEHAQEALSGFLGREATVAIENITILPLTMQAQKLRNAPRTDFLGCHIRIFGEIQAELYCYLRSADTRTLLNAILHNYHLRPRELAPLEQSALAEVTGVLANSYWQALHSHIPLNWHTSTPTAVSRIERIFTLASRIGHYDSLVFHTELAISLGMRLNFCLIPGADCLNRLLHSLEADHLRQVIPN